MLKAHHLTDGIGVKTARNTPCTSMQDALRDRNLTSVTSAKQKKIKTRARYKELT